jgi:hypothetical protein
VTASAVETRASDSILSRKEELARAITDALYAGDPALSERFGEAGHAKCIQDMHYCLEHLAPAVALNDPALFARYVLWVEKLLAARGIGGGDVRRSLEATQGVLAQHLRPDEAACMLPCLQAGLASLAHAAAL